MPDSGWWEALWPDPAKVLDNTGVRPGMDVVDLCSGDGWFTFQIAKIARQVFAIDIDRGLIEDARVRLNERGVTNCVYIAADAYDVAKVIPSPADHVFLANAFHGVPDKPRLCREIHAALKPCGLLAVVSWHARPREETVVLGQPRGPATELRMTPGETVEVVEQSGFKRRAIMEVSPYHYAAIFDRDSFSASGQSGQPDI